MRGTDDVAAWVSEAPRERGSARFEDVVLPHLDAAYNLARYLLRDPHQAEDAVQDACLRAVRHFDGFRGGDSRAWLLRIVRNVCYTLLRRDRTVGDSEEFDEAMHGVDDRAGPEADLAQTLATESLRERLDLLPLEFREVIVLRELEGFAYKEIAQIVGVPIGTVMSRLSRARGQLQSTRAREPR